MKNQLSTNTFSYKNIYIQYNTDDYNYTEKSLSDKNLF